ncbi:unnamed protein product [Sphagnum troendelagicum]|uniref:Uncharacterized protein n=1 Tax=Sphagnum troendelagicum TaxID=128251 RepID=A0ABP0UGX3_9BRYO
MSANIRECDFRKVILEFNQSGSEYSQILHTGHLYLLPILRSYYSLFGCKSCVLRSVFSTTTAPSPKFGENFGTWPGGGSWMVGRNPCRPIRAVADVSYEKEMEMPVQDHADHLLILVDGLNARLEACGRRITHSAW